MAGKTIEISDANFDETVLQAEVPVLLDFWAAWCGPCLMIGPTVEQIADDYDGRAVVGKVDVDSNRDIALKYDIRAIPTLLIFKGGEVVDRLIGNVSKADLITKLDTVI
ncbi:MAG: thioredoxin [Thermoanaerobaculales bacterium]|nr:thioredoxin [Thermoanaerobaculales bacterium]